MVRPELLSARRALVAGALLLVSACSHSSEAPPRRPPADADDTTQPASVFNGRLRKLDAWGDEMRTRIDPAADGWPTEVASEWIEKHLQSALALALGSSESGASALTSLCASEFAGATALVPEKLDRVFSDGELDVFRAPKIDDVRAEPGALGAQIAAWRRSLASAGTDASTLRVDVAVVHARATGDDRLETTIVVRTSERSARDAGSPGPALQQNIRWSVDWRWIAKKKADPKLFSLRLQSFEEIRAASAPFTEVTRAVFGREPFFEEEIARGAADYHLHQDRLSGQPVLGMHGIAIGDVDSDGLEDVYLPQPAGQPNRLFIHQPDGTVKDVAHEAGVDFLDNCGPAMLVDLDNDGHLDLVVAAGAHILINWNDGHGHFQDGIVLRASDEPEITSMGAADFDGDGYLDIYACRYVKGGVAGGAPVPYYAADNGATNLYWHGEGNRRFKEMSAAAGLEQNNSRFSLALICEDLDEDGYTDLYVINDFGRSSFYKNDGKGHFKDVAAEHGLLNGGAGMGATCADFDLDGHVDVYVTNMQSAAGARIAENPQFMPDHPELRDAYERHARGNTLLRNRGDGTFEDVTDASGTAPGGWAWGSMAFDWNNDGYDDLFVPNGFDSNRKSYDLGAFFWRDVIAKSPAAAPATQDYLNAWDGLRHLAMFEGWAWNGNERKYAYLNLGSMRFADVSSALGVDFQDDGRAAVPIDWDDDGRVDLLLRNRTGPRLRLLRNDHPHPGHFVSFDLVGTRCNRDAIGAQVRLEAGGRKLRRSVYAAEGYMCSPSRRLHFGLGNAQRVDRVEVRWPDGTRETLADLAADHRYRIVEGKGAAEMLAPRPQQAFARAAAESNALATRAEDRVVLFDRLPMKALDVPLSDGGARKLATFAGSPVLITLWSTADPTSLEMLGALARERATLDRLGVKSIVLAREEAGAPKPSGAILAENGIKSLTGIADARFTLALEVILIEVFGPYEKLTMPLDLLVDRAGQLVAVYSGERELARIVADVQTLSTTDPDGRFTEALLGGHWARFVARDLEGTAQTFSALGREDLARFYREEVKARNH
jgi:hypothetical protein